MSIFLADHNADRLQQLVKALKTQSIEAAGAGTAQDALRMLAAGTTPRLIVISASLSDIPVLDVCRQIRADKKFAMTPLLVLLPDGVEPQPFQEAGVKEFIDDPFENDRLIRKIKVILDYGKSAQAPGAKTGIAKILPFIIIGAVCVVFILVIFFAFVFPMLNQ